MAGERDGRARGAALADDDGAAVRPQVPEIRERRDHELARRQARIGVGGPAGNAVEPGVAHDAVDARVRAGRDRGVREPGDRGQVVDLGAAEPGPLAAQAIERRQGRDVAIEVVLSHAVEDEEQHEARMGAPGFSTALWLRPEQVEGMGTPSSSASVGAMSWWETGSL